MSLFRDASFHRAKCVGVRSAIMQFADCTYCDTFFKNDAELTRHVERVHKRKLNFACDQCAYK